MQQYECPLCKLVPFSHSLVKISDKKGVIYYYTRPSQAILYYDVKSIISHYDGVLSEIPESKEWIWIFDSLGFSFIHAIQIKVATELTKLISNKFTKNLKKIVIINPAFYIKTTLKVVMPFLNDKLKDIIEIDYETKRAEEIVV